MGSSQGEGTMARGNKECGRNKSRCESTRKKSRSNREGRLFSVISA